MGAHSEENRKEATIAETMTMLNVITGKKNNKAGTAAVPFFL